MHTVVTEPIPTISTQPPRLLDQLRQAAFHHFGRPEPAERHVDWVRRFILFHGKRHPRDLKIEASVAFLTHLAQSEKDPLQAVEQAREAIAFLYHDVLQSPLAELPSPQPPRLLDRLRHALRVRHAAQRTEASYVNWVERYIRFHGMRHPNTMGAAEIEMFLTDLAVNGHVSASTQNQAFSALLFLYQNVLAIELPRIDALRARRPKRLPAVLSPEEVAQLLDAVQGGDGVFRLMARLLYGTGMRREECCKLRVQELDLGRGQIVIRHGKGGRKQRGQVSLIQTKRSGPFVLLDGKQ